MFRMRPKRPILRAQLAANPRSMLQGFDRVIAIGGPQRPRAMQPSSTGLVDPTWAHLPWIKIAWVGPGQDLDTVDNQANIMGIDRYVVLDPLVVQFPNQPTPPTTGWLYVVGSAAPPKHVRQVASQQIEGPTGAPFFSKGKFVDIAVVSDGLGVAVG